MTPVQAWIYINRNLPPVELMYPGWEKSIVEINYYNF